MANFVCKNCSYKFEGKKELDICPYCGEKDSIRKEESADELLGNIEE